MIACLQYVGRSAALAFTAVALLALAMPSFLVNGNLVSTQSYYPEQRVVGEFLAQVIDSETRGEGVVLYDVGAASIGWYNLPFATRISGPPIDRGAPDLQEFAREGNQRMISSYLAGDVGNSQHLLWADESEFAKYEEWFGPDGANYVLKPAYKGLEDTTRLYDNGLVQLGVGG